MSLLKRVLYLNKRGCQYLADTFPNWFGNETKRYTDFDRELGDIVDTVSYKTILELGGADRPALPLSAQYSLHGVEVSDYNNKAKDKYDHLFIQSAEQGYTHRYDLIYSITLLEHVKDNASVFQNIFNALNPHGQTLHYFPCKNCFYAIILRVIGHKWQNRLIGTLNPEGAELSGYETFFDKCMVREMGALLRSIGFTQVDVIPYFRANSYFDFFIPAFVVVSIAENICRLFNWHMFATGVLVKARVAC